MVRPSRRRPASRSACFTQRSTESADIPNSSAISHGQQPLRTALYRAATVDLTRIDGISVRASRTILTKIGLDLSAFPTKAHFMALLGLAPRTAISEGKTLGRKNSGKALGANPVAGVLRMSAASLKSSPTALGAALRRKARHKCLVVAIFRIAR